MERSLRLNLFFLRILKEHAIFLVAALLPVNAELIDEGKKIHQRFNKLLQQAVKLAAGQIDIVSDAVTPYTLEAEHKTVSLSQFPIDTEITVTENKLRKRQAVDFVDISESVRKLNDDAASAARWIIHYKTKILNEFLACRLFTFNYPLLIEHIRREALEYLDNLEHLQNGAPISNADFSSIFFWNQIMKEHAEFTRGLLDPSEVELLTIANEFTKRFGLLLQKTGNQDFKEKLISESKKATTEFKDFNEQGTLGLLQCSVKAIVLPLLADHLIRESNHFLLILDNKI